MPLIAQTHKKPCVVLINLTNGLRCPPCCWYARNALVLRMASLVNISAAALQPTDGRDYATDSTGSKRDWKTLVYAFMPTERLIAIC